ncbi:MAG: hypothetical protein R3241_01080 [Rheinheimera sp.]|nr:hypothetical protein [Rheinheimera sp.]
MMILVEKSGISFKCAEFDNGGTAIASGQCCFFLQWLAKLE